MTPVVRLPTEISLKMQSISVKGSSFFLKDNYDWSVRRDLGGRKMTGNDRFVQRLFPSSKILSYNPLLLPAFATWDTLFDEVERVGLYDPKAGRWADCPNLSLRNPNHNQNQLEKDMADFLNRIVDECVALLVRTSTPRRWTAEYSTSSLLGHDAKRKPDLVLLDDPRLGDWRCVRSFGEMKSSSKGTMKAEMFDQITGKTAIIFSSQDNREYVLSLGFLEEVMELHKIDRGGCISSFSIQINDRSQWRLFLRTILSLALGHEQVIGYDTSIDSLPRRKPAARMMSLQYYPLLRVPPAAPPSYFNILSTIFIGDGLIGRGTCVFRVQDQKSQKPFIIKDTWHDVKRNFTEGQILQIIKGIPYVPEYVEEVIVSSYHRSRTFLSRVIAVNKTQGGMDHIVEALSEGAFDDRIHLRLQTKGSKTKLITEFKNRKELAMALLCCVKAHKQAYEERGVLHRDIHIGNIFIDEGDDDHDISSEAKGKAKGKAETEESKGMLGDWGHAECFDIPYPCDGRIKKPTALPRTNLILQHGNTEYSDSEDENWMNHRQKAPEASAVPPRTSQRNSKNKKKAVARPESPIPSDSEMSDATSTEPTMDDIYAAYNPWNRKEPKVLLGRTGAATFTATEIMLSIASPNRRHLPHHDLESFFYVIVIITMLFTKPGEKRSPEYWKDEDLGMWWNATRWTESGRWKYITMKESELQWSANVTRHIRTGYFKCWMPHINELRNAIFGGMTVQDADPDTSRSVTYKFSNSSPISYDKMISVLEEMVKVGEEEDEKEGGNQRSSSGSNSMSGPGEWDFFALESSDDSQASKGSTDYIFTKVEAFRIMNAVERSVVHVPNNVVALNSDVPAPSYPAVAYVGDQPNVGNIPRCDDSSIRTSDLPTASRSTLEPSDMPSPSIMPTSSGQTDRSKRRRQMQPGDEPERKKSHLNQPASSRKDPVSSTSKSASLKTGPRTPGSDRKKTATSTRAPSSKRSRRRLSCADGNEYLPKAKKGQNDPTDAMNAAEFVNDLSPHD